MKRKQIAKENESIRRMICKIVKARNEKMNKYNDDKYIVGN